MDKLKKLLTKAYRDVKIIRDQAYKEYKECFRSPETLSDPIYPDEIIRSRELTFEIYDAKVSMIVELMMESGII
ncbi:MAG: hypothetical protein ACI4XI_06035 [Ruminococcus sp.]